MVKDCSAKSMFNRKVQGSLVRTHLRSSDNRDSFKALLENLKQHSSPKAGLDLTAAVYITFVFHG